MSKRELKNEHVSGKRFVRGLGIGFLVIAIGLFFGIRTYLRHMQASKPAPIALRWQDRDLWPKAAMRAFELEYSSVVQAETGKRYRKAEFSLSPDNPQEEARIEKILLTCAALARDLRHFQDDATATQLQEASRQIPGQFYPAYLLAAWHWAHGQNEQAQVWMAQAVALAPSMLLEDRHAPNENLPSVAIAFDRLKSRPKTHVSFLERLAHQTQEQTINRDLVLVYPTPQTDGQGRLWLPVFHDMYRWQDPTNPKAQVSSDWFSMSPGVRVGYLNDPGSQVPPRP